MPAEDSEMQRRHSSATETSAPHGTDGGLKRQTSHETVELIPTRTTKVATSKPAANPLQFIKVGPCNLYRSAQEQLKKVEEVKKVKKEVRDDAEDWQSNLDNWKCSRRKKQEHIIERVVEVKKLELEEHDRNRRRSKTFSEMMEERNSRGRKSSLPLYQDDGNDLSDLGISSNSKSSTSSTITEEAQYKDNESVDSHESENSTNHNNCVNQNGTSFNGHKDEDSSKTSSETEEYTYERAIQSYVNYAETRGKSRNVRSSSEESYYSGSNGLISRKSPAVPAKPRRGSTPKIEEKLSELEQLKKRSMSTTDLSTGEPNRKSIVVPKVDINKRRELFEKIPDQEDQSLKLNHRLSGDFSSSKSIRERLSSLGKQVEESPSKKTINRLSGEISVKDRLSNIEKFRSTENLSTTSKISKATSENVLNAPSVRDRLNSLERSAHIEVKTSVNQVEKVVSKDDDNEISTAESPLPESVSTEINSPNDFDSGFKNNGTSDLKHDQNEIDNKYKSDEIEEHIERTSSPEEEIYESTRQQHYRHRSLDSLDIDSADNLNNDCFGRVQSLEDLDFCRNYPASSLSGDTDREDSGIHTADVSSSVSQADDCDSHLDSSSVDTEFKFQHHPTIIEEISRKNTIDNIIDTNNDELSISKIQEDQISVSCVDDSNLEVTVVTSSDFSSSSSSSAATSSSSSPSAHMVSSLKLPLRTDHNDPLPVIPECPSEPVTPSDVLVSLVACHEGQGNSDVNIESSVNLNNYSLNENSFAEVSSKEDEIAVPNDKNDAGNKDTDVNITNKNDVVIENDNSCVNTNTSTDSNLNLCYDIVNNEVISVESATDNSSLFNDLNKDCEGLLLDSSVKLVQDNTSSSFSDNKTEIKLDDNQMLDGNGDNLVVCMRETCSDLSSEVKKERRQTVIEICEKINSTDLSSPLSTPVITVDGFNFSKQKMQKDPSTYNQENEESAEHIQKSLTRKENNNLNNDCLKTDSILNEKNEIYNDTEKCHQIINTVDYNQPDSANKSNIVQENNDINLNILPVVTDRTNFYLDNSNKLPVLDIHQEIGGEIIFPLSPSLLEPPKEKPPPPPSELSDDDENLTPAAKPSSLRRLDSTKRIKKEIRQKRSSFLGLEGCNDDSLEPELEIQPPPDMTSFLQEERRLEQMMYRQSICSESDSNQGESRDSGVELDRSHHDDISWPNHNHSRHDSEIFGNASTTSEEEENIKKERELLDIMKQNDQQTYINNSQDQENIGEKLALRLRELEAEKSRLEWEREEEINRRKAEEAVRCHQESLIQAREEELRKQETVVCCTEEISLGDREQHFTGEMLVSERERLEREQEELTRQRETLLLQQQWAASLQDVSQQTINPTESTLYNSNNHDYRRSMPNLQQEPPPRHTRPPPPIPPAKPLVMPRESLRHQDKPVKRTSSPQQMTRQTLQALSAAPRSRLISTDTWIQTKRKPKQDNYNYQHWLIQEAEHRRITELQQRQANVPPRRPAPPHPSAYPGQQYVATGRETGWQQSSGYQTQKQPSPQQWANPPSVQPLPQGAQWVPGSGVTSRSDKPLPDSIIQTLTQRVQNRINNNPDSNQTTNSNNHGINIRRRPDVGVPQNIEPQQRVAVPQQTRLEAQQQILQQAKQQQQHQEKMLSVSGKKKCSHCGEELGRGAAMIIETLRLFYHIDCFKCCVCCVQLGDGLMGTDVRVRNNKLHCQNCYSSDDGVKFSCV